jgi:hypothetical protein
MFLVDKDGRTVAAKFKPDPPGGRGVDSWELSMPMTSLNDYGLFINGFDVPEEYQYLMRKEDR